MLPLSLERRLRPVAGWVGVRWIPTKTAVILGYHRVTEVTFDPFRLAVSPAYFEEHMEIVRKHFRPLTLASLVSALEDGNVPDRSVVVTFDDGYLDGLLNAKPILERHEVPATVFVSSGYVDSGTDFWWHELERLCFSELRPTTGRYQLGPLVADWGESNADLYLELWQQFHELPQHDRDERLLDLRSAIGADPPTSVLSMSNAQLSELAGSELIEIGAHSVSHPSLPMLPRTAQLAEIETSRRQLEERIGGRVRSFSYPHGDLTTETIACVREAGFDQACSSVPTVVRSGSDPFALPRRHVLNWRGDEFAWQLSRFFRDRSRA